MVNKEKIDRSVLHKSLFEAYEKLISSDSYIHNVLLPIKFKDYNNGLPLVYQTYVEQLPNYWVLSKIIDNALIEVKKAYSLDQTLFILNISIKTRFDTDHIATAETIDINNIKG